MCDLRKEGQFGPSTAMVFDTGFYNVYTGKMLEVSVVRNWAWNPASSNKLVYFSTFIADDGYQYGHSFGSSHITPARQAALDLANQVLANPYGFNNKIEQRRINIPVVVEPWCQLSSDCANPDTCMGPCSDEAIANGSGGFPTRIELEAPPGGAGCVIETPAVGYEDFVMLKCSLGTSSDVGNAEASTTTPIGFQNTATEAILKSHKSGAGQ
jgi:hypothetical protein